jgi:hypothetical protein
MKRYPFVSVALAALLLATLVTACGGGPASIVPPDEAITTATQSHKGYEGTAVPTVQPETEERTMTPTPPGEATEAKLPSEAEEAVQLAQEDLRQRLDLAPEAIRLVSVEAVDWPDTSLGCPEPGMMYAQVITPGFRVVLEAERETYEYHTHQGRVVVLCDERGHPVCGGPFATGTPMPSLRLPTPIMREPVEPPFSANLERLIEKAKQDLSRRLEITPEEMRVVHIEMAEWPDTRLGCGEPGLTRLPVAISGYRVILSARGWEYVYHTDRESGVVYCPKG